MTMINFLPTVVALQMMSSKTRKNTKPLHVSNDNKHRRILINFWPTKLPFLLQYEKGCSYSSLYRLFKIRIAFITTPRAAANRLAGDLGVVIKAILILNGGKFPMKNVGCSWRTEKGDAYIRRIFFAF